MKRKRRRLAHRNLAIRRSAETNYRSIIESAPARPKVNDTDDSQTNTSLSKESLFIWITGDPGNVSPLKLNFQFVIYFDISRFWQSDRFLLKFYLIYNFVENSSFKDTRGNIYYSYIYLYILLSSINENVTN